MRKCDSCGKLYQESKDVFCPHCGAVAQKQCIHGSSFDSKRYDRGEIYKSTNPRYNSTSYNQGSEPHIQRKENPYNTARTNGYGEKIPQINLPDLKTILSKGKKLDGKFIGAIVVCIVIAFNMLTGLLSDDNTDYISDYEVMSEQEEYIDELYTVVNKATVEMVDTDGDFKTFTLEISGMGFDDSLPDGIQSDISDGTMTEEILSEDTFAEMMICDFSKEIVEESSYNNAIDDSYFYSGEQIDGKCKYEFTYSFDYGEIVHIAGGVGFYLNDGRRLNAELPFSAFSLSEDGEITYYISYANSETAWNTVFSECSNEQELNRDLFIAFDKVNIVEEVSDNG